MQEILSVGALLLSLPSLTSAHTWVEEFQNIDSNGSFVGDRGFSRGYVARTDPGFDGNSNLWLLPSLDARNPDGTVRSTINGSDLLCHPAQRESNYTSYPMLKAPAGGHIGMKYLENGHVTLPWTLQGKPKEGGTVLVFATTEPKSDEKIADVLQWTKDKSGGDKRGFLLAAMNYDDGECHQLNECWVSAERQILHPNNVPGQEDAPAEKWCESDIKIPEGQPPGQLTLYWAWNWGTVPGEDCFHPYGKDEWYTNCADIEVVASGDIVKQNVASPSGAPVLQQQDPNSRAVKNFASRTAAVTTWPTSFANWADYKAKVAVATPASSSGGPDPSWVSSCQASILADQSAVAANPQALPPNCPAGSYAPTGAEYTAWSASVKAKATDVPLPNAAPSETVPMTSAPATSPMAAPSAPAAPPAPSSAAPAPSSVASGVTIVTETVITISTVTVEATPAPEAPSSAPSAPAPEASSPAPSAPAPETPPPTQSAPVPEPPAPAPSAPAPAPSQPPAPSPVDGQMNGFPVISPPSEPGHAKGARSDEHLSEHRRHAREFRS